MHLISSHVHEYSRVSLPGCRLFDVDGLSGTHASDTSVNIFKLNLFNFYQPLLIQNNSYKLYLIGKLQTSAFVWAYIAFFVDSKIGVRSLRRLQLTGEWEAYKERSEKPTKTPIDSEKTPIDITYHWNNKSLYQAS